MVLHTLTAIFTHWQQFLNTVLQLPSWTTASRAYCRILYKPDELQLLFWYPWALGPLWQATWDFLHEHLSSVMWALFSCGSVCWSHAHMEHCWLGITEAMAEVLRYWQIHHHNYQKKKKQVGAFSVVFHNMMLSCGMWSVPHANKWRESSNVAESWCRQCRSSWRGSREWTTIDLFQCHPPWPGSHQSW